MNAAVDDDPLVFFPFPKDDSIRHPSKSKHVTLLQAVGFRFTPWRHVLSAPRAACHRKGTFWSAAPGFANMGNTTGKIQHAWHERKTPVALAFRDLI